MTLKPIDRILNLFLMIMFKKTNHSEL